MDQIWLSWVIWSIKVIEFPVQWDLDPSQIIHTALWLLNSIYKIGPQQA